MKNNFIENKILSSKRPYIIAEIGINHNGSLKLAKDKRRKEKEQLERNTTDINSIQRDVTEIKTMLTTLIEGRNNGR